MDQFGGVLIRKTGFVLSRWIDIAREFDTPALGSLASKSTLVVDTILGLKKEAPYELTQGWDARDFDFGYSQPLGSERS